MLKFPALLASFLLLSPLAQAVCAQEGPDSDAEVTNTSIVWVKGRDIAADLAIQMGALGRPTAFDFGDLQGIAVPASVSKVRSWMNGLRQSKDASDHEKIESIVLVEPDGWVKLLDDSECDFPSDLPDSEVDDPAWLQRVNGPMSVRNGATQFRSRVWVLDSGVSRDYDILQNNGNANGDLNVLCDRSTYCDRNGCSTESNAACQPLIDNARRPNTNDKLGHGTLIAGIIGADDNDRYFRGVAPGVRLIPVKIFNKSKARWKVVYHALSHIYSRSNAGDIVNISWGASWDPMPPTEAVVLPPPNVDKPNARMIEELIRKLADENELRFAIAAGNTDVLDTSGYVETITPARAGAYRSPTGLGLVVTVSAVDDDDEFWENSAFGNGVHVPDMTEPRDEGYYKGPPDFAEPGKNLESLWPGLRKGTCSGTSFATAIMSGLLVRRADIAWNPQERAINDPSAILDPIQNTIDPEKRDRIGVCVTSGTCQEQ